MKFLHLSDLHFGKTLCEYSLLSDQRHWCRELLTYLEQEPCDAVVIAGDLYDRSVPSGDAVQLCDWFLGELAGRLSLPVLCIAGNHDSPQRLSFGAKLYRASGLYMGALPQRAMERVRLEDQWGPVDFFLLPYLTPGDGRTLFPEREIHTFHDAYEAMMEENRTKLEETQRKVLVAHGFFARGGDEKHAEILTSDSEVNIGGTDLVDSSLFDCFSYCAFGHLHASQEAGSPRMRYCGSPLKYSVSEERQRKCALLVELDGDGNSAVKQITFPALRDVRSVSGTMEELLSPTKGAFSSEDYVQITVLTRGTELGAAEKLRNVYPNYLQIRYQDPARQVLALEGHGELSRLSLGDAYRRFYLQVMGHDLEEDAIPVLSALARETEDAQRREEP